MSEFVYEENTRVVFCTSIADIGGPSTTELNAGDDLSPFITKDGISTPSNQNMVDAATITEHFDRQRVGSYGGPIQLTMKRNDDQAEDPYELFAWGTEGFIVIRYGVPYSTTWANGQRVEVYPVEAHEPIMANSAANEQAKFTQQFAVTAQPDKHAAVGAS